MIAPDRRFVRRLRSRVRATVKASPALRRERKRTRLGWQHRHYTWTTLRFLIPLAVAAAIFGGHPVERVSALLVLWSGVVVLHRCVQLVNLLHAPGYLWIFFHLPVTNTAVFQHQARLALRSSFWLGADWLALAMVVSFQNPSLALIGSTPLFVFAHWASALALATSLVRWFPRLPYAAATTVLYLALFVTFQTGDNPAFVPYTSALFQLSETASPPGWLAAGFTAVAHGQVGGIVVALGVGLAAAAVLGWNWITFRANFNLERTFEYAPGDDRNAFDGDPRWVPAEPVEAPALHRDDPLPPLERSAPVDVTALRSAFTEAIEQPAGLALFRRGVIERGITRLLTLRQRTLADFLQPQGFGWTRGWLIAFACVLVARLLYTLGYAGTMPAVIALGGAGLFALPLFGGSWLGFSAQDAFQARIGLNSFAPVGFWETARLLLAVSVLRLLVALPLLVLAVRFGFNAAPMPWEESMRWALRAGIAALALQPLWVIGAFSRNSNDSSARWWFSALCIVTLVLGFFLIVSCGVMLFLFAELRPTLIVAAVLLGSTHAALLAYGWAYNRGLFDLVARPRTG